MGLKAIGTALSALHSNNIVHGNVSYDSVYVLPSGEWRLFGFELVSTFGDVGSIYRRHVSLLPEYRRPPETLQVNEDIGGHVSNADSWGMACLIYEVLGLPRGQSRSHLANTCKTSDVRGCRSFPRTLQSGFMGLCAVNHKMRHSVDRFVTSSEFIVGSEFVRCIQSLDELSLKDAVEREHFFEHMTSVVDSFPKKACENLVLSKIQASFNFGIFPAVIDPIMKIAARIKAAEKYATHVAPVIVSLFASQDKMVRYRLLQRASEYGPFLPKRVVNEQVWPLFVSGFSSTVPGIREYSVRALVFLAGSLNENIIRNNVCKYINQLQQDNEGAIRTNATISLCFIADFIPEEIRSKTLVHGFGRMLKDPFVPSRLGALRSFHTTLKHLTPQHIAEFLLPGLGPLAIDTDAEVRCVALDVLRGVLDRLTEYNAKELLAVEEKQAVVVDGDTHNAAVTDAVSDVDKTKPSFFKWGWHWGAAAPTESTATAATSACVGAPDVSGAGAVAATDGVNCAVKSANGSSVETTATATCSLLDTVSLVDGTSAGQVNKKTKNNLASLSASGTNAEAFSNLNVVTSKVKEPTAENRAMKLRKKGFGASRVI